MALKYSDAGVDIETGHIAKMKIGELVKTTYNINVLGKFGGFGGLFDISMVKEFRRPVLVSSVDGVGTKLKIAFETGVHITVGQDIVNHCVDDILVLGAKPLFFLDYIASGKMLPDVVAQIVQGMAISCKEAQCVLIGGETAEMPDFYATGEYDLAGTIVGVVDAADILDGHTIQNGDVIIGLRSNGLHTNGYSLARKIVTEVVGKKYDDLFTDTKRTFGEELLRTHVSYLPILPLIKKKAVKGCAHITGGGFHHNIDRILPEDCNARIDTAAWEPEPIFKFLQAAGKVETDEMYRTFNMGMGMAVVVDKKDVGAVLDSGEAKRFQPKVIGEIVSGNGTVQMEY